MNIVKLILRTYVTALIQAAAGKVFAASVYIITEREKSCRLAILAQRMRKAMTGASNVIYPGRDSIG